MLPRRHAKSRPAARDIVAIGITNQRETTLLWDRASGRAVHRAIVWQDRRTADFCARLKADGHEAEFATKTGLLLDPYFSGTKLAWLLNCAPDIAERAARGELAFGTVDTYLLWRLTGGKVHATDATNASRTLLFDIHEGRWDDRLLALLGVPKTILPAVLDCSAAFGVTDPELFGAPIPVYGIAGDQQAALIGQACFAPGMVKATYGTGCFALLNTGTTPVASKNKLLTTIAYQLGGVRSYALEGSIFIAGAAVQWLRDNLHIVQSAEETGALAAAADPTQEVVLVPAFVGLGAPYWRPEARGALFGLTRATGPRELAQAALESVCFQTVDLLERCRRIGAAARSPLCASTAAWRIPTSPCNASPISSAASSTGRRSGKPQRSAPPISPACALDFFPSRTVSPSIGNCSAASRRRWMPVPREKTVGVDVGCPAAAELKVFGRIKMYKKLGAAMISCSLPPSPRSHSPQVSRHPKSSRTSRRQGRCARRSMPAMSSSYKRMRRACTA